MRILFVVIIAVSILPVAAEELRLLSYNVRHGTAFDGAAAMPRQVEIIKRTKAQVIGLQEIDQGCRRSGGVDQAAEFANHTGCTGHFGAFMDYDGGKYGMVMLSALTVLHGETVKLPDGREPRVAVALEVETAQGHRLLVVNVHFDWTSEKLRLPQAKALIRYLDGRRDLPAIVLGDYNAEPGSPTLAAFVEAGFVFAPKPADARLTWNAKTPSVEIDHVATRGTDDIQLRASAEVLLEAEASDHRPVLATLHIAKRP